MVLSTITILTFVIAEFTFETKLNKIRIYNQQDKGQAKLNAESGLNFALAKMRIYQVARNLLEKNSDMNDVVSASMLEAAITEPFVFPIPVPKSASIIQKQAAADFIKDSLISGNVAVSISIVSGFLNPNNLRIPAVQDPNQKLTASGQTAEAYIETEMVRTVKDAIDREKEVNEDFANYYSNIDPETLVRELKFYVNSKQTVADLDLSEFEALYSEKGIVPKHAPLTSLSELYLLAGWDDTLITLVKDRLTVHEVSIIPLNEITSSQLRVLFPTITDEQIKEFFKYRDGAPGAVESNNEDTKPHPFKDVDQFKSLITQQLQVVSEAVYDARIKEFEVANIRLGVAGKMFKVVSTGEFNRATYTITAYIDLPIKPSPIKKDETKDKNKDKDPDKDPTKDNDKKDPLQFLEPRVVELIVN